MEQETIKLYKVILNAAGIAELFEAEVTKHVNLAWFTTPAEAWENWIHNNPEE